MPDIVARTLLLGHCCYDIVAITVDMNGKSIM